MRHASPPMAVGSTWPAVYDVKYVRVSQVIRSSIPCARSSHRQRTAISGTVPIMIATASANQARSASSRTSIVVPRSTFQTRYASASPVRRA